MYSKSVIERRLSGSCYNTDISALPADGYLCCSLDGLNQDFFPETNDRQGRRVKLRSVKTDVQKTRGCGYAQQDLRSLG